MVRLRSSCRLFVFLLAALLVPLVAAQAEDRRTDRTRLTVMQLNGEFLWDGVAPEDGNADVKFPWKGDATAAAEHMKKVAKIIIQSDPDIVNLCEVEHEAALKLFNDNFLAGRGYKPYFIQGKDTTTGQDMGLLTRIDPEAPIERDDRKGKSGGVSKSVSKNYVARLRVGETKVAIIGAHLLARPSDPTRRFQREAQAQALRAVAAERQDDGYEVIMLGDFNDFDYDPDCRDQLDSKPISNVLKILRDMKKENDPSDDLANVAAFVPKGQRYTNFWDKNSDDQIQPDKEYTAIDHILLSSKLKGWVDFADIPHTYDPREVTDHFPVVVRLRTPSPNGKKEPAARKVRIASLLPNPSGDETQNEKATLKNLGAENVDLSGWKLRDLTGKTWKLDELGIVKAGEAKTIKRNGQAMALNNGGDTVDLIDDTGKIVQTVTYPSFVDDEDDEFEIEE